jgi:hypothetical protein
MSGQRKNGVREAERVDNCPVPPAVGCVDLGQVSAGMGPGRDGGAATLQLPLEPPPGWPVAVWRPRLATNWATLLRFSKLRRQTAKIDKYLLDGMPPLNKVGVAEKPIVPGRFVATQSRPGTSVRNGRS